MSVINSAYPLPLGVPRKYKRVWPPLLSSIPHHLFSSCPNLLQLVYPAISSVSSPSSALPSSPHLLSHLRRNVVCIFSLICFSTYSASSPSPTTSSIPHLLSSVSHFSLHLLTHLPHNVVRIFSHSSRHLVHLTDLAHSPISSASSPVNLNSSFHTTFLPVAPPSIRIFSRMSQFILPISTSCPAI
ncbi:hypothetical protein IWX90DRAFT_76478 [Phyllosticta citrichinensis]|uniref:Uncharacterized protein n=1 Tax=Phyllosticta citrichinensis TaxID=1130410 RepID=A0ABR1XGH8_9PEZI